MNKPNHKPLTPCATPFSTPIMLWSEARAQTLTEAELLLYRSNLLGADLSVTNFGGGNTSAKIGAKDPLTQALVKVLWVKGSGGDLSSMKLDGFATLYQDKLLGLESLYQGQMFEDDMVGRLGHCTFNLNQRPASIDTPLHAFLPFDHVDHVHPDAIIAIAASKDGEAITKALWAERVGWLKWQRPGFDLGLKVRDFALNNPKAQGVMLAGHGIISWAQTSKACYEVTLGLISDAVSYINSRLMEQQAFGGPRLLALEKSERASKAIKLMPLLRAMTSTQGHKLAHFCDDEETLEFVNSHQFYELAAMGTSCPDHFLRTKIAPLCLDPEKLEDTDYLQAQINAYCEAYKAYYQRCAGQNDPAMRDPSPVIILIPGIGRISLAHDRVTARLCSEFYGNAINVMRGAQALGGYQGLDEREAFNIEYWSLEEAKLQRQPKPKSLAGKIAIITGAAGGIGAAAAHRLLNEGACVMLLDRDEAALMETEQIMAINFGKDVVASRLCDVTQAEDIETAFNATVLAFGGLDILVANAGIASSAAIEQTTLELWRKNYDVLVEGYFLSAKSAFGVMKANGGGSIIFIGSKNGVAAAANASAYASAKAASLHLARCLALEGAAFGIRVNTVNPDAVIKGSRIWNGDWRKERADTHGIDSGDDLEAHYRNRSMLKLDVLPQDVANAIFFFASHHSSKSTGNMINVDAGNAQAFTR